MVENIVEKIIEVPQLVQRQCEDKNTMTEPMPFLSMVQRERGEMEQILDSYEGNMQDIEEVARRLYKIVDVDQVHEALRWREAKTDLKCSSSARTPERHLARKAPQSKQPQP